MDPQITFDFLSYVTVSSKTGLNLTEACHELLQKLSLATNLSVKEIFAQVRTDVRVAPRAVLYFMLYKVHNFTLQAIAEHITHTFYDEGRIPLDHTNVLHGCKIVEAAFKQPTVRRNVLIVSLHKAVTMPEVLDEISRKINPEQQEILACLYTKKHHGPYVTAAVRDAVRYVLIHHFRWNAEQVAKHHQVGRDMIFDSIQRVTTGIKTQDVVTKAALSMIAEGLNLNIIGHENTVVARKPIERGAKKAA